MPVDDFQTLQDKLTDAMLFASEVADARKRIGNRPEAIRALQIHYALVAACTAGQFPVSADTMAGEARVQRAAQDMLEALRAVVAGVPANAPPGLRDVRTIARAAIAKATGE